MSICESTVCKNMNVGKPIYLALHNTTGYIHDHKHINIPNATNMHKSLWILVNHDFNQNIHKALCFKKRSVNIQNLQITQIKHGSWGAANIHKATKIVKVYDHS